MRIALVVPGGVDRGGTRRVIPALLNLIERLARRHSLHVVALDQEADFCNYPLLGATVTNLGQAGAPLFGSHFAARYKALLRILRREGPFDLLHAFWAIGPGTLAVLAGRRCRVPAIVSVGGGEFACLPDIGYGGQLSRRGRWQLAHVLRHAAVVTAGSRFALRQCPRSDALWLPLGVDTSIFRKQDDSGERKEGPPWRLLQVASLNAVKDQYTAIRALRLLLDRGLDVELQLVGEDTLNGALQQFVHSLSLGDKVEFSGFRTNDQLPHCYSQAHLYVQSSVHESQGVSVLEAAACGVPIVGTDVGLLAGLAPHAAVAVPVRDPAKLADAIEDLLHHPDRRAALSCAAHRFARTYDAACTANRFESLYEMVTNKTAPFAVSARR